LKTPDSIFESVDQDLLVKLEPVFEANRSVDPCRSESIVMIRNMNRGRSLNGWNRRRLRLGSIFDVGFIIFLISQNE
jgi:hypothetical protein